MSPSGDLKYGVTAVSFSSSKAAKFVRIAALSLAALLVGVGSVAAQVADNSRRENYVPTIWVDPDGCEHWVLDDGAEGFMTPNVDREGRPVCNRTGSPLVQPEPQMCGRVGDQYFATDKYYISSAGRSKLADFFRANPNQGFIIIGHTDSRASDAYNITLSKNRANAVAAVGRSVGARIVEVRGMGERQPIATNSTIVGMAQNRRVEILCVN